MSPPRAQREDRILLYGAWIGPVKEHPDYCVSLKWNPHGIEPNWMYHQVFRILERDEAERIVRGLAEREFADGKGTASGRARDIKHNLQATSDERELPDLEKSVIAALERQQEFQAFALPKRFARPIFNRYEPGMHYGSHIDNSLLGGFNGLRSDLSMTLFLNSPAEYDGGELVIESYTGAEAFKLDAGEAIVYSAGSIHHVAPVTRGTRLAAITWMQSAVRLDNLREILYDLFHAVKLAEEGKCGFALSLSRSYHNLIRYAAEL